MVETPSKEIVQVAVQSHPALPAVKQLISREITDFVRHLHEDPQPVRQDERGFLLAWFARFLPEAFEEDTKKRLLDIALSCYTGGPRDRQSDPTLWIETMPFQAAVLVLTRQSIFMLKLRENLTLENSGLRRLATNSLSFAPEMLSCENADFTARIGHNLAKLKFFTDEQLLLYAASSGPASVKIAQFETWQLMYGDRLNRPEAAILSAFATYHSAPNASFARFFGEVTLYGMFRALAAKARVRRPAISEDEFGRLWTVITERVRQHPLSSDEVRIETETS